MATVNDIGVWHEIANSGWYKASGYDAQRLSLWIRVNSQDASTKKTTFEVQTYTEFKNGGVWQFSRATFTLTYATTRNINTYTTISTAQALISKTGIVETHDSNGSKTVSIDTRIYMSTPLTWDPAAVSVTLPKFKKVTLNPNGGSFTSSKNSTASSSAQTYWFRGGNLDSLTDVKATRSGYTCSGWYTAASGGTKILDNNGNLNNIAQDWSLYPHWTKNKYNVTYNANGGTSTPTAQNSQEFGSTITLAAAISKNNTSANTTLTTSFNTNGGSTAPSALTSTKTVTTKYTFSKWALNSTSGTKYDAGGSFTIPASNSTMYATWTSSTASTTYSSITLPAAPTRTGYTFAGWYTASSGGTKAGNAGASYKPSASGTLYAHWTPNSYNITWNLGGGSFAYATNSTYDSGGYTYVRNPTTVNYDNSQYTVNSGQQRNSYFQVQRPTRPGYIFTGWSVSGMDSTTHYYYINGAQSSTATSWNTSSWSNISPLMRCLRATSGTVTFTAQWSVVKNIWVKVGDTWKHGCAWINVNGTWKPATKVWQNVNGTWKDNS